MFHWKHYTNLSQWMNLFPLQNEIKDIADRYHWHLSLSQQFLKEHNLLPAIRRSDRSVPKEAPLPIAIYLDNIRSAHNVGSIIRTTEAFSLGQIFFSKQTPFIDHKQVKDASMGAHEWVICQNEISLDDLPKPIFALETSDSAVSIYDISFPKTFTLILGNEEYGCSTETLCKADALIEIPLFGRKNSLNVSNAFAIAASMISHSFHFQT